MVPCGCTFSHITIRVRSLEQKFLTQVSSFSSFALLPSLNYKYRSVLIRSDIAANFLMATTQREKWTIHKSVEKNSYNQIK